ncbi:MAG TPA: glycerol kinase GlpK [Candidatus Binataceae bacterium]|jgi:glycerol kinase|nr:glycerol kinase GlpK [Candidatus Binataceae bacterium]
MAECVLAIDQGTTGNTVMVIDAAGRIRARAYAEVRQFYPRPGWVEHDADQIYRSVIGLGRAVIAKAKVRAGDLAAIGITNQRETFVVWERKTGRPLHRAIVWQCRRSADICKRLREREAEVTERTGLLVDPYFSATKLKWLLDQQPSLRRRAGRGELCFGTIETWLIWKLSRSAAFVTDFTNASRTLMLNLERLEWDAAMLKMLDVPRELLPTPVSSRGPLAEAVAGIFGDRAIPIMASIGDQQAALFGQGGVAAGDAKVTYGTGAFALLNTGKTRPRSHHRLISTVALGAGGELAYALEGSVFIAGAAVQWLRDELKLIAKSSETRALAARSADRSAPYFVPAFVGLGAPYWDSEARGAIFGLTRGTTRADLVRATLDSVAYQVNDVLVAMEADGGKRIAELRVDGGAAANDYLMQFQADLLGRTLRRPSMAETTVLGAAMLAGLAAGVWRSTGELKALRKFDRVFRPRMKRAERKRLLSGWRDAVARTLSVRR